MSATSLAVIVAAYMLGTFPTAVLAARRLGHDVLGEGSGNPGASNTFRVAGKRAGLQVLAGDVLKGVLASGLGYLVAGRPLALAAGAAAVVGHCWPVTRRFKGGKGVATAAGLAMVLFPAIAAACAVVWVTTARVRRTASLSSLSAALTLVLGVVAFGRPLWEIAGVAAVVALVLVRHRSNLGRLVRGEEEAIS